MVMVETIQNKKNDFITITNKVNGNTEVTIEGVVGKSLFDDGYTFENFKQDISNIDGKIVINISSVGGSVDDGLSIYDYIRQLENKVVTKITQKAFSIASIIALAGDKRYISKNANILIHHAQTAVQGNAKDFSRAVDMLNTIDKKLINIYKEKTNLDEATILNLMENETLIDAESAIAWGFAHEYMQDKDFIENNNENEITNNMDKKILEVLGVGNETEALDKITQLLATTNEKATDTEEEEEVVETPNEEEATNLDEEEKVEETNETEEVKEEEVKDEEVKDEEVTEEDDVEALKAEINRLKAEIKEKEDAEKSDATDTYLAQAVLAGKILSTSTNKWSNMADEKGLEFVKSIVDEIPSNLSTGAVAAIKNINAGQGNKSFTKSEIIAMIDKKQVTVAQGAIMLEQIK